MRLHIRRLVVWPNDPSLDPRSIEFSSDGISVISGWSSTGKSAVAAIIDYVLGSGRCAIPVGVIRDLASWYELELETADGPLHLARRRPDGRQVSDVYWTAEGERSGLELPYPKATTDDVKRLLNRLSGLSDLTIDPEDANAGRASFRDIISLNFLPQHVVANPYTLFYKADSSAHRDKLRRVLPLALGIVTNKDLARTHALNLLGQEERRVAAELAARRKGIETWRANANGTFLRAQELGLLPEGEPPTSLPLLLSVLRELTGPGRLVSSASGRVSAATGRLEALSAQERTIASRMAERRRRLRRLRGLRRSARDYGSALDQQRDHVAGRGWFREAIVSDDCILCGSSSDQSRGMLDRLEESALDVESLVGGTRDALPMVDAEIAGLERSLADDEREIAAVQQTMQAAEAAVGVEQGRDQTLEAVYRFLGGTEQALTMLEAVDGEGGLESRRRLLLDRMAELREELDQDALDRRREDVSRKVSSYVSRFVEGMGVQGADGYPFLDFNELTLRFQREDGGRADSLWEIGGGENWMAYHLAALLAIHGVVMQRGEQSPVPTFLIIDQPTQVYFPNDSYEDALQGRERVRPGRTGVPPADDMARTRRIFAALSRAYKSFEGQLQIIVVDHADHNAWSGEDDVSEVENWRDDRDFLIPDEWIEAAP